MLGVSNANASGQAAQATQSRRGKYFALVHEDLSAVYSRDLHKWLLVAPVIGVVTGLLITGVVFVILELPVGAPAADLITAIRC